MLKKNLPLALALVMALALAACGGNANNSATTPPANTAVSGTQNSSGETADTPGPDSSGSQASQIKFDKGSSFLDEYSRLYNLHEKALYASDDVTGTSVGLELVSLPFGLTAAVGYSLLDLMNDDGKFGDIGTKDGFYEKNAAKLDWGTDYTAAAEDNFAAAKEGDHLITRGGGDLGAGSAWDESSIERGSAIIKRERYDYQFQGGSMTGLSQEAADLDFRGGSDPKNTAVFVIAGESRYEFVVGKAERGTSMGLMVFKASMTRSEAKSMMESAGYTIKYYGLMEGGKLALE